MVALIDFAAVRSTPLRRTVLLKYSAMVLLSSSSSEIASTKAKFAWKSRGVVSAVSAVVIPSEAADSKAAQHSASAAEMAAARRSGDNVEAEGDELTLPRRDATDPGKVPGKPPRCLLDRLPMAQFRNGGY